MRSHNRSQRPRVRTGGTTISALGEEILAWKSEWLFTKPGAIFSYANPGLLAGRLCGGVCRGKPYADVMEERVFGPAGMASSTLNNLHPRRSPLVLSNSG